jgi:hypothetical protein
MSGLLNFLLQSKSNDQIYLQALIKVIHYSKDLYTSLINQIISHEINIKDNKS